MKAFNEDGKTMHRYNAVVSENGKTYRFPIYALSYKVAKKKLKSMYPTELLRTQKIKANLTPFIS